MALVARLVGMSSDEDKQLAREAQIAKYLMLLYDECSAIGANAMITASWRSPGTPVPCTVPQKSPRHDLSGLLRGLPRSQRTRPDIAGALLTSVSEDEVLRFLKEPTTEREVRNLAFAYFTPDEYPTHRMFQES